MGWQEELRAKRAEAERWIRQRDADLRRAAAVAEAKGRQVYERAIRTGETVLARTPAEVRALGLAALQGKLPQAVADKVVREVVQRASPTKPAPGQKPRVQAAAPSPGSPQASRRPEKTLEGQLKAALSGAVDEFSLGLADRGLAAADAVANGGLGDFAQRYDENMGVKRAEDARDARDYGTERNAGRVVGFAGSVAAMGGPGLVRAALTAAPRGKLGAQLLKYGLTYAPDPRGLTRMMAAGGGVSGVVDQSVADVATGHRSNPMDYLGAAAGGAVGGAATRYAGPVLGGGVGGAATSALSDLANSREVSLDDALDAGRLGAAFGGIGDAVGQRVVRGLSPHQKGKIGDTLSETKAGFRGEDVVARQRRVHLRPQGQPPAYTVADLISVPRGAADDPANWIIGESKLGLSALTDRQEEALRQFGDRYVVDFWRYSDIGKMGGGALSPYGGNLGDPRRDRAGP